MTQQATETYRLEALAEKRIIRQLALEWVQSRLPVDEVTFVDCLNGLTHLHSVTRDIGKTEMVFEVVFQQAHALGKSSEWLAHELQFETLALTVDSRPELVRLYLQQSCPVTDAALDAYNERLARRLADCG